MKMMIIIGYGDITPSIYHQKLLLLFKDVLVYRFSPYLFYLKLKDILIIKLLNRSIYKGDPLDAFCIILDLIIEN
jgi:hypothetical protein